MKIPSLRRLLKSNSKTKNGMDESSCRSHTKRGSSSSMEPTTNGGGEQPTYLLDRLGGMVVLNSVVMDFLNRVGGDKQLMKFFEGVDFRILSAHQKRFFAMAFTQVPDGVDLTEIVKRKHQHLFQFGLNESHFDLVAQHLEAALKARGFNNAIIVEAIQGVAPLRSIFEQGAAEAAAAAARASGTESSSLVALPVGAY